MYAAGTLTLSTIYSDNSSTAKANPFTADVTSGLWSFYAADGRYDVKFSGGGISAPFTLGDLILFDPDYTLTGGVSQSVKQKAESDPTPEDFGAVGDGQRVVDGAMTSGLAVLTSASASFVAADVGKKIVVLGAGAGSITLETTIASRQSANQVTLSSSASTTVSNALVIWGTDDTAAFAAAQTNNYLTLRLLPVIYCVTQLRLKQATTWYCAGVARTTIAIMGGGSGDYIAMTSGEIAQKICIRNVDVYCNQVRSASAPDGIDLGTETPGTTDFANGSLLDSVRVLDCPGVAFRLRVNVGSVRNLWAQNVNTPAGLSIASSRGYVITGSTFNADILNVEGRFEGGDANLSAGGGTEIGIIQCQVTGNYASVNSIEFGSTGQRIGSIYFYSGATRQYSVAILTAIQAIEIGQIFNDSGNPQTATYLLNDIQNSITITSASCSGVIPAYRSDLNNTPVYDNGTSILVNKRFQLKQGSNVTAANDLTLATNGGANQIVGNTQINAITTANWRAGAVIPAVLTGTPLIKHNTAGGAGTARIFCPGGIDFQASANSFVFFYYDGTQFQMMVKDATLPSGTYTPTLTDGANVAASTAFVCQYFRVGNVVTVTGKVEIDPTAAAPTATELGISLPVASNFAAVTDLAGVCASHGVASQSGGVFADAANDRASLNYFAVSTANLAMWFSFSYTVI